MSGFREVSLDPNSFSVDANARLRVGQLTTLADLKCLGADESLYLENTGTGTGTFSANTYNMSVTSGQFLIRRGRHYLHSFSGKSQMIECTFDNFQIETNVSKRVGFFSSNNASPYNSNLDGFFLENDGTTFRIMVYNNGTAVYNVPFTSWDNYSLLQSYDWSKFTVIAFDFVWLGGAALRMFVKTSAGFILAHTITHAGTGTGTITQSPNHCVRYEIRSSTGTGSFRYICAQVATEGSVSEGGKVVSSTPSTTAVGVTTVGTIYPLHAIRKRTGFRDKTVRLVDFNVFVTSADQLLVTLQLNPTLSAGLTYSTVTNTGVERAYGNGTITVTTPGTILYGQVITQNAIMPSNFLTDNFLASIGVTIGDVSDQLVVCGTPVSATVSTFTSIRFKEF